MELLLVAALIALLRWAAGRFSVPEEEMAAPPPVPAPAVRRPRRPRAAPAPPEADDEGPAAPVPAPPRPPVAAVAPPLPSVHARDFATRAALRRAVVAREVLGPPLSLR